MASRKVKELIDVFRNNFRSEKGTRIPLALRQEPVDIVFTALLEDDKPSTPPLAPIVGNPIPDPFGDLAQVPAGPALAQTPGMEEMLGAIAGQGAPVASPEAPTSPDMGQMAPDPFGEF